MSTTTVARISDRAGHKLHETREYETREHAAQAAFNAKTCSTARAIWVENLGAWRSYGMDIRWHGAP